jgi:hypothetical protein
MRNDKLSSYLMSREREYVRAAVLFRFFIDGIPSLINGKQIP